MSALIAPFSAMKFVPEMSPERERDCAPLLSCFPDYLQDVKTLISDYTVPTREAVTRLARIVFADGPEGLKEAIDECAPYCKSMTLDFTDRLICIRVPDGTTAYEDYQLSAATIGQLFETFCGATLKVASELRIYKRDSYSDITFTALKAAAVQSSQLGVDVLTHNRLANFQKRVVIVATEQPLMPLSGCLDPN